MRIVIQRVKHAAVSVDGAEVSRIKNGVCVLVGVGEGDTEAAADWLADKLVHLRIFEDGDEKMNLSLLEGTQAVVFIRCRRRRRAKALRIFCGKSRFIRR